MRLAVGLFSLFKKQHQWDHAPSRSNAIRLGMIAKRVANDLHFHSDYCDNPGLYPTIMNWNLSTDGELILNGDIIDLTCCPKEKVPVARADFKILHDRFMNLYRLGNHEANGSQNYELILEVGNGKKAIFRHGDLESNFKKWFKYRKKQHGATKLDLLKVKFLDNMDWVKANVLYSKLPDGFLENAADTAIDFGCYYYVCGHFHVKEQRRYTIQRRGKSVCVVVLPAHQINEVWL